MQQMAAGWNGLSRATRTDGKNNNAVGKTERILRYKIRYMQVYRERVSSWIPSRVAPQELTLVPADKWDKGFIYFKSKF